MLRVLRLIVPVLSVLVLVSCNESEQQKLNKLTEIQKQNSEMQAAIKVMQQEAQKTVKVEGMDEKMRQCEGNVLFQTKKNQELDALIDALTLRRDAMRIKLEDFRRTHPAD